MKTVKEKSIMQLMWEYNLNEDTKDIYRRMAKAISCKEIFDACKKFQKNKEYLLQGAEDRFAFLKSKKQ